MNYYEHHIGDYAQATAHLTFVEDAAYSRLMRKYYAEEKPLPVDLRSVQRLVMARTEEEREAVAIVLQEFFVLEEDGWHQKRIDEEIARFHEKRQKKVESANARWGKKRNASASPDADDSQCGGNAGAMRTHEGDDANASDHDANAMLTSHQSPDSIKNPVCVTAHEDSDLAAKPQGREAGSGSDLPDSRYVPMLGDWQPDQHQLGTYLLQAGLPQPPPEHLQALLVQFRLHYASEQQPLSRWYSKLVDWIRRNPYVPKEKPAGPGRGSGGRHGLDRLDEARRQAADLSWAEGLVGDGFDHG